MKPIILFLSLFILVVNDIFAQSYWARYQGGGNNDETTALAIDNSNNSYITGYFSTNAGFENTNLASQGLTDAFVAKYNSSGNLIWAMRAGGSASDRGLGVAVDAAGNSVICGFYSGTANFGAGLSLTASGNSQDIFIAYYNSAGIIQWVRSAGSTANSDRANDVAFDAEGNVLVSGQFSGSADFSGTILNSQGGSIDVFTAKYSSTGDILWAKKGSGAQTDRGLAISTDNSNNVYVSGQFSGDITFDNPQSNSILNATFLIKYNSLGEEQWFRVISGSGQSTPYDMTGNGSDIFLTGDFSGTLSYIGSGLNESYPGSYSNSVFVLSINGSGSVNWAGIEGSDNMISSRGIAYRNNKISIAGRYECTLNEFNDEFGESTFNSIGFRDAFIASYNNSGVRQYARNFGSQKNDDASAIGLNSSGKEIIAGTFTGQIILPVNGNVAGTSSITGVNGGSQDYCEDSNYGAFKVLEGEGELDGFLINAVDLSRHYYDYYYRSGSGCDLSIPEACIRATGFPNDIDCGGDTISGCAPLSLQAISYTGVNAQGNGSVGPNLNYQWNVPGQNTRYLSVSSSGVYTCTISSEDGCYIRTASVYADVAPQAAKPLISDDVVINTDAFFTSPITVCAPAEIELTATVPDGYEVSWLGPGLSPGEGNGLNVTATESGVYSVTGISPDGCQSTNSVNVVIQTIQSPEPVMPFLYFGGDSISVCGGSTFSVAIKDSTFNSIGDNIFQNNEVDWWLGENGNIHTGGTTTAFFANADGYFTVNANMYLLPQNDCGGDTLFYEISDSVYVDFLETPEASIFITAPSTLCPGDSAMFYVEGSGNYTWTGTGNYVEIYEDSALINAPGTYVISTHVIAENGCEASLQAQKVITQISTPEISMLPSNGLICPGSSVSIATSADGSYVWQGPNGPLTETAATIDVFEAGLYFCEVSFDNCALVSNTLEISEYSTPFILPVEDVLCEGETVTINLSAGVDANIQWESPLSGSDITQTISEPGVYSVSVESCGIQTIAEVEILGSTATVEIVSLENGPVCEGDTFNIAALGDVEDINWSNTQSGDSAYVLENTTIYASGVDEHGCNINSNGFSVAFTVMPDAPILSANTICFGDEATVFANGAYSIFWLDTIDGSIINTGGELALQNPIIESFDVYAYQVNDICVSPVSYLAVSPVIRPEAPKISSNAPVCLGEALTFSAVGGHDEDYNWFSSNVNLSGSSVTIYPNSMNYEGFYSCYAEIMGCPGDTAQIDISLFNPVRVSLPEDTTVCRRSFVINTDTIFQSYQWSDESEEESLTIEEEGVYWVTVEDINGCKSSDDFAVEMINCSVEIPNIFTPNSDGRNDYFSINTELPQYFRCDIYNRWGQLLYSMDSNRPVWDGTNIENGNPVPESTYYYVLYLNNFEGTSFDGSGYVFLKRD